MVDLNLYYTGDSDDYGNGIITSPLHLFFQEIELAIKCGPNEIWGCKYSIELSSYLFNQYITISQIKNELVTFISQNCEQAKNFQWDISVDNLKIDNKEMIHIICNIYDSESEKQFVQKFLLGE